MEKYIKPSIKVKEIEFEAILAASDPNSPADEQLDDTNTINDASAIESKKFGNVSCWDE